MMELKIAALARGTGASAPAIRYYESIGLLPAPARTSGNQRTYGPDDAARVGFILRCRALGFTLDEIGAFLRIARSRTAGVAPCREIVQRRLAHVRSQMETLSTIERRLVELLDEDSERHPDGRCRHLAVAV